MCARALTWMMATIQGLIALFKDRAALNADILLQRFPFLGVGLFKILLGQWELREHLSYPPLVDVVSTECAQDTADSRRRRGRDCRDDLFIIKSSHDEQTSKSPAAPNFAVSALVVVLLRVGSS